MAIPKKATTQLAEFADFIGNFTRNLLYDDEPVPIIRQMMQEAGYIDYIKENGSLGDDGTSYTITQRYDTNTSSFKAG